jgi:hypothetical protein
MQVHDAVGRMLCRQQVHNQPIRRVRVATPAADLGPLLTVVCSHAICMLDLRELSVKLLNAGLLASATSTLTVAANHDHEHIEPLQLLRWAMPIGTHARCDAACWTSARPELTAAVTGDERSPGFEAVKVITAGSGPALCQFFCTNYFGTAVVGLGAISPDPAQADLGHIASVGKMLQRLSTAVLHRDFFDIAGIVGLKHQFSTTYSADLHDVIAGASSILIYHSLRLTAPLLATQVHTCQT